MSAPGIGLSTLLRAVKAELDARVDLVQAPLRPEGSALTLTTIIDDDGVSDVSADGREWQRDLYHAVVLQMGDATWSMPEGARDPELRTIWRRTVELVALIWARDETAAQKLLRAVVSAVHRRCGTAFVPVADTKLPRRADTQGIQRRLVLRLFLGVGLDDDPFDGITRVVLNSAGVVNTPGQRGDGAIDAFEET